jgi:predicted O-methyltransferase YrrM
MNLLDEIRKLVREEDLDRLEELLPELVKPFLSFPAYREYFSVSDLPGIDLRDSVQLGLLTEVFPRFQSEYDLLSHRATEDPREFHLNNDLFDGTDALIYYCMIRHLQPRLIIEVGSGMSTRLASRAMETNGRGEMICIEPYPDRVVQSGLPRLRQLIVQPVQNVPFETFSRLHAGDILFIDSSHVVKIGSDVNYLLLEVLPRLAPGVVIHIHDVFLPLEYRRDWVKEELRFWNEQYLLHAFLLFNREFQVLFGNTYAALRFGPEMKRVFPRSPWWGGVSFWIERRAAG